MSFQSKILGSILIITVICSACNSTVSPNAGDNRTTRANTNTQNNSSNPPIAANSSPKPASQMAVTTSKGKKEVITIDEKTDLIYMATWCPYSQSLKTFLADKSIKSYAEKRNLIFVFSDELPTLKKKFEEQGLTKEEVRYQLDAIKVRSGWKKVYDPSFFKGLPGEYYFAELPSQVDSFPSVASGNQYPETLRWIYSILQVPEETAKPVLKKCGLL